MLGFVLHKFVSI